MKTIEERATEYANKEWTPEYHFIAEESYIAGAEEKKAIDEKYIKLLEEDRNAFIAFCYNIINGKYISVIDAAKEQLSYLKNNTQEE